MNFKQKLGYMFIGCLFTIAGYILTSLGGGATHAQQDEKVLDKIVCRELQVVNKEGKSVYMAWWQDRIKRGASFYDVLTDAERKQLDDLSKRGHITEADIPLLADRFMRSDKRENALEQAFKGGFLANLSREWGGIKRAIANPNIGAEASEEFLNEKGLVGGLANIMWNAVTTPVRSCVTILSGGLGESENPLGTLVGSVSIIPVGRFGASLLQQDY